MTNSLLLGAHMSTSGGISTAFDRGASIGCTTMQVFVKNNNQWRAKPFTDDDIESYKTAAVKSRIAPVFAHAAYLINLCAASPTILQKSRDAMVDELERCNALGIKGLIFHPGAHLGKGEQEGINAIAESLNIIHERAPGIESLTVLETTAGQGTAVGYRFEHLRSIIDQVDEAARLAVCMDTCHVFAAGYDISNKRGWEETIEEFDNLVGLDRLVAVHTNDSKKELGSHVDRHEHIGKGMIGIEGFTLLMNDPRFENIPKILETPKEEDMREDIENMDILRSLRHTPKHDRKAKRPQ